MSGSAPDKVVLITGAAGGLGTALVTAFAGLGWRVVAGTHQTPLSDTHGHARSVPLDMTDATSVNAAVETVLATHGHIDALINAAGQNSAILLGAISEADWDQTMSVNLKGAFLTSRAVIRPMLKQRSGHIINLSSFAARSGPRGQAAYAAAKAGLIGLTQSLAKEAGSRNVRVNAILPGVMPTGMTAATPAKVLEEFAAANALGRINDVDEVARFVVFLAGMQNVSGQVFQLDSRVARWT